MSGKPGGGDQPAGTRRLLARQRVDDNQGGRFVVLNIPTTLAAKVAASGGLSPSEGKARKAKFLGLEHNDVLEYGLSELDPPGFSHLKFFLLASANGGVEAYLGQLSEQAVNGNAFVRFALELADLGTGVDEADIPMPFTWNPVSTAEFEFFGRVVGSENPVFLTPENSTNQVPERVGASLVYEFSTGGDFTISGDSGSTSRSGYPRRVQNSSRHGSYPTYNGPNNAYTGLNSRAKLISFSVTNTDLDVTPTGRILWKGTDGHGAVNFFSRQHNLQ